MKKSDFEFEMKNLLLTYTVNAKENREDMLKMYKQLVEVVEKYTIPKSVRKILDTPDGDIPVMVNEWE